MVYECPWCKENPRSHSFKLIKTIENVSYIYCKPSTAELYYDSNSIKAHFNGLISDIPDKWVFILDCEDFSLKHAIELGIAKDIATILYSNQQNILNIVIMNPNAYIDIPLVFIRNFLNQEINDKIIYNDKILEFLRINS
jgi:hypothetical protein